MIEMDRLCRRIVRAQENAEPDNDRVERLRDAVLDGATRSRRLSRRSPGIQPLVWAAVVGACVSVALLAFWLGRPLTAQVAGRAERISAGDWVAAPETADVPVWFSDGTVLDVGRSTRLQITSLGVRGADVVVPNGRVHVAVVHRPYTRWSVGMGPYRVRVTGTSFSADFDAVSGELVIAMHEGSVVVSGGCLERAASVTRGQTFRARCDAGATPNGTASSGTASSGTASSGIAAAIVAGVAASSGAVSGGSGGDLPQAPEPTAVAARDATSGGVKRAESASREISSPPHVGDLRATALTPSSGWKSLAAQGRYAESMAALGLPFAEFCEHASSADVLRVAVVARQLGQTGRAEEALRAVRRRFAGSVDAMIAAFDLGVLASDARGDFRQAVVWFQRYLDEAPSGALRREALGRLVETGVRAHDLARARDAARRYLAEYPTGPHADLARSLSR